MPTKDEADLKEACQSRMGRRIKNKKSLQKKHDKQNELYKHHLAVNKET